MIIIAGYSRAEAGERDATVQALVDMIGRARVYEGCVDFSMSADPVDPERINLFECWRDEPSWKAWRKAARPPKVKLRKGCVNLYRDGTVEAL